MNSQDKPSSSHKKLNRRHWLAFGVASAGVTGFVTTGTNAATGKAGAAALPLTAQATEGPYYFDAGKVRADITEGLPGVPLDIRFAVMDSSGAPVPNARVDVWHCNAAGIYSGYAGQGDSRNISAVGVTFLRGTLTTGADGLVVFRSVYPGWYEGRTTHIHFKVFSGTRTLLTSQFFLPDALSEFLYTNLPGYKRQQVRDILNRNDGIALMTGSTVLGTVREEADRYVASLDLVVDPLASHTARRPPASSERLGPPPGSPGRDRPMTAAERLSALVPAASAQK
ncbi:MULTISPECIES: intradiol ring-cleavage dioxygenase [Polaromonas]|uniref:Intradiol ring-cleavage dioxygenase n=1 Tax=Polaromonas aquatica TaxID=332657 RepID=A0ABW1TSB0_9BURK